MFLPLQWLSILVFILVRRLHSFQVVSAPVVHKFCQTVKGETITRVNGNVLFFAGKCLQNF